MAMARLISIPEPKPLIEMNTTPLIDVMLVLLIVLIITIPIQSHAVKIDIPSCDRCPVPRALKNEVAITRTGAILWNGVEIGEDGLRYELALTRRMEPAPELHLRPDPEARYELVDRILADIKRADVKKFGFVGNEAYHF
jgi:biopolymer transport protein ExbD